MVLSGIYQIKIVNLTIVAVFVHFVSLTLAQSSTAKTIENNEFLKVRICISLYKQQNFFSDESMVMLRYTYLSL